VAQAVLSAGNSRSNQRLQQVRRGNATRPAKYGAQVPIGVTGGAPPTRNQPAIPAGVTSGNAAQTFGPRHPIRVMGEARHADCRAMRSRVHQWLFGDLDTARLLDMDERLQSVSRQAMGILALALLVCVPWLGPWTLPPLALAMVTFRIAHVRARTSKHREYVLLGAWLSAETIIAFCVALTGGPRVATITWLALPIVTLAARFNGRVVAVGSGISLLLLAAVCLATDFHAVLAEPPLIVAPAALILATAKLSTPLMQSDLEHRGATVIDGLTGLLNRRAFDIQVDGLAEQAEATGGATRDRVRRHRPFRGAQRTDRTPGRGRGAQADRRAPARPSAGA
jgi:hypothetical protein